MLRWAVLLPGRQAVQTDLNGSGSRSKFPVINSCVSTTTVHYNQRRKQEISFKGNFYIAVAEEILRGFANNEDQYLGKYKLPKIEVFVLFQVHSFLTLF